MFPYIVALDDEFLTVHRWVTISQRSPLRCAWRDMLCTWCDLYVISTSCQMLGTVHRSNVPTRWWIPQKKKKRRRLGLRKKKETLFYMWTNLPSRVGLVGTFFFSLIFCFLFGGKNDFPTNTKIFPHPKKRDVFLEKNWKSIFSYFQKNSAKFSSTVAQNGWLYMILANWKEILPKWKIWHTR